MSVVNPVVRRPIIRPSLGLTSHLSSGRFYTNLWLQSQAFDNATWTKGNSSITATNTVAPDGTATADTLKEDATATTTHRLVQTPSGIIGGVVYTFSLFCKRGVGARHLCIQPVAAGGTDFFTVYFDLGTNLVGQTINNGAASIKRTAVTPYPNGFFRYSVTGLISPTAALASGRISMSSGTTAGSETYNGDNTSTLIFWGAQLETGYQATDYIPTTTVAVTREES